MLISANAFAKQVSNPWTAVAQTVDVSQHQGKAFKLSADIRSELLYKKSLTSIWVRIENTQQQSSFFKNDVAFGKTNAQWQRFMIEGTLDKNAHSFHFGALMLYGGIHYYDDFKLEVEISKGQWREIALQNSSFESDLTGTDWQEGVGRGVLNSIDFNIVRSTENPSDKTSSLRIAATKLLGSGNAGQYVNVNGVDLYYEIHGKGTPLLMLHGNGQSMTSFLNQVRHFSQTHKVILLDSRGRGNSSTNENVDLTYALQVEDTKLFLDAIGEQQVDIVGWSDGAIIGLMLAKKYPDRVGKLVSMAANIFPEGVKDARLKYFKTHLQALKKQHNGKYNIETQLYNMLVNYPQMKFEELKPITAQVLVMVGDKDIIKHQHTVKIFESMESAQLAIVPNTDHFMPSSSPQLFNSIVERFLKE